MAAGRLLRPTRSYRLSDQDAFFLYAEGRNNPLHIGSIGIFDGKLDFVRLLAHVGTRLHLMPRYRQRLRPVPLNLAHPVMEDDPNFHLENHMIRHRLPAGTRYSLAIGEMMRCFESPLDRSRPLWEIHSFEGLEDRNTAIMSKVHHSLADGVAGVELLKVLFDVAPDVHTVEAVAWIRERSSSRLEILADGIHEQVCRPFRIVNQFRRLDSALADELRMLADGIRLAADLATRRIVPAPWNSGLVSSRRSLTWIRFPFSDVAMIRDTLGGSVNDFVLTTLTEGAARYLARHGCNTANRYLRIGCPVNLRDRRDRSTLGNRVSMIFPLLPAWPMDVAERLEAVSRETIRIERAGLAVALERLTALAGDLTPPLVAALASVVGVATLDSVSAALRISGYEARLGRLPALGINFIATNVRGPQSPLYILGHKCLDQIPLMPLGATFGYGVAILSYDQSFYFGMIADPHLMPDLELMKAFVAEAFAELVERCEPHQAGA